MALVRSGPDDLRQVAEVTTKSFQPENKTAQEASNDQRTNAAEESDKTDVPAVVKEATAPKVISPQLPSDSPRQVIPEFESDAQVTKQSKPVTTASVTASEKTEVDARENSEPGASVDLESERSGVTHGSGDGIGYAAPESSKTQVKYELAPLANGDDILELDLPDRLEMTQLLDLVAEYVGLDYMFDPEKIRGQAVSLRLHGKLQGRIRVKDLYPLLESVLKFKGLAATCHKGNLVTIVPVADALDVDPALLDPNHTTLDAGDMVVTRIFDLQYVSTSSAMNLLNNMKLSVAASPIEEVQALIITCYAHRMARIERLLNMIDKPGRPKDFRFRSLKYTMAKTLVNKVEALVVELQTMPGEVALESASSSSPAPVLTVSPPLRPSIGQKAEEAYRTGVSEKRDVYLDADERTNRILMIGDREQLAIVDAVIDALDVAQYDPRTLKVYDVVHLGAAEAKKQLEELEIIGRSSRTRSEAPPVFVSKTPTAGKTSGTDTADWTDGKEIQVTIPEATNSLLIKANEEQHAWIETVLSRIDVPRQDVRALKVYQIQFVAAKEVEKILSGFGLIDGQTADF